MINESQRIIDRCRNIVYYYQNDERPYAQYLHIIRLLKSDIKKYIIECRKANIKVDDRVQEIGLVLPNKILTKFMPSIIEQLNLILIKWKILN